MKIIEIFKYPYIFNTLIMIVIFFEALRHFRIQYSNAGQWYLDKVGLFEYLIVGLFVAGVFVFANFQNITFNNIIIFVLIIISCGVIRGFKKE
jgi:hypothetical protein